MDTRQIAELEWLNYVATMPIAQVTPDLEVQLSEEAILTSSKRFPYPDSTHACLLRARPETADALIEKIIHYFQARHFPVTIFISPACTPADLTERLLKRGFHKNEGEEAWLVFNNLLSLPLPPVKDGITVETITQEQTAIFVKVMGTAFEFPEVLHPYLVELTQPSVGLPTVDLYLAWVDGQPVGTASLVCHGSLGTLGGVGVIRAYRTRHVALNLVLKIFSDTQKRGIDTILLQTAAGAALERMLCMHGFKRAFTRVSYSLYET